MERIVSRRGLEVIMERSSQSAVIFPPAVAHQTNYYPTCLNRLPSAVATMYASCKCVMSGTFDVDFVRELMRAKISDVGTAWSAPSFFCVQMRSCARLTILSASK